MLLHRKDIPSICAIKKASKRYLTVLELLIVFAILAVAGGAIAFNVRAFYMQQQALTEMSRVSSLLSSAQELMMIAHLDATVEFALDSEEHLTVSIVPQSSVPFFLQTFITNSTTRLPFIEKITFEDAFQDTVLTNEMQLWFAAKGFRMNRGVLKMEGQGVTRSIILLGYPTALPLIPGERVFYPHVHDLRDELEAISMQTGQETKA